MAKFSRLEVLNSVVKAGLVPVFYDADLEVVEKVAKACAAGGSRLLEFTNRQDFAPEVFKELSRYCLKDLPDLILGVGTILDEPTAAMYIAYGANFVVGPVLNASVARLCNRRKIPYMPGCGSASEISDAEELGVEIVKVFPCSSVGGPAFVRSVLGPCPWTRIMPTGGVEATKESIEAWFNAGVAAVGIGSHLIPRHLVQAGDYDAISARIAQTLLWIKEARGEPVFQGIDHVGLYPCLGMTGEEIASWYAQIFGFKLIEGTGSILVEGIGPGHIEVLREGATDRCHIVVRVADFDEAVATLQSRGIELEDLQVKPDRKVVFVKQTDPAGNRVHLVWQR